MASLQQINAVYKIPGADKICQYGINGWLVVDQIGKYSVGDKVIYCEVDSWIPNSIAPFLTKPDKTPKEYLGVMGEKLRTVRLRNALSQGLILPLSTLDYHKPGYGTLVDIGEDLSQVLGILKYEAPQEYFNADTKGNFPAFLKRSDQERIQNCYTDLMPLFGGLIFEVQEKMEGQSHTAYYSNGEFGVCSRNLELKDTNNTFWNTARKYDLQNKLQKLGRNIAIVSEQCGPGISGNIYSLTEHYLFVFDIFDIDTQEYLKPSDRQTLVKELGLTSAPILYNDFYFTNMSCSDILKMADGTSVMGHMTTPREGLVFKANTRTRITFKAVSNEYLLKHSTR